MQTQNVSLLTFRADNIVNKDTEKDKTVQNANSTSPVPASKKNGKALPIVTAAVAIASLGLSAFALKGRSNAKGALDEYKKAAEEAKKSAEKETNKLKDEVEKLTTKLGEATSNAKKTEGNVSKPEEQIAEKQNLTEGYLDALDGKIKASEGAVKVVTNGQIRNVASIDNLNLMQNVDNSGNRIALPKEVKTTLATASQRFITGTGVVIPALAAGAVVWLPTAE